MKPLYNLSGILLLMMLCSLVNAQEIRTYRSDDTGHIHSVVYMPDGKSFITGCSHHIVKQWDIESGKTVKVFQSRQSHPGNIHAIAVSPNSDYFVVAGHAAMLFDLSTGTKVRDYEGKHVGGIKAIAISPNGKYLASSGSSGETIVEIWDLVSGKHLQTLSGHWSHINSLAFTPDSKMLASGSHDKTIKIWELRAGNWIETGTFEAYGEHVHALSFSFDGRYLASGNQNGSVGIWDMVGRRLVRELRGHTGHIHTVAFSPDGSFLASGSYDNSIKLWDVETGKLLTTYSGHTGAVHSVSFSPDGFTLLSGSGDKTAKLWDCSAINVAYVYKNEINAEINANTRLFAPKDEFETSAEYERRKMEGENLRKTIVEKYQQNYPAMKRQKIRNSYKTISLPIENIGTYNADQQTLPVRINGRNENLQIPPAEARSFKENLSKAEVKAAQQLMENGVTFDVYNIQVIHPITGSVYLFGKQRKPLYMDEQVATPNVSDAGIPALNATIKFKDTNGNSTLEGNETAQLIVTINNEGKGNAKNLQVNVTSDAGQAINFDHVPAIATIPAGQSQIAVINLKADNSLITGETTIKVSFQEDRGFQPNPLEITVATQASKVPQLSFTETYINEVQGNKNNAIERNETIEATIWFKNTGQATAQDVRAVIRIDDPNIVCINPALLTQLVGTMRAGDIKSVKFSFAVNNNYTGANQLPIRVVLSEMYAKHGGTFSLGLDLKKTYQPASPATPSKSQSTGFVDYTGYSSDVDQNIPVSNAVNPDAIAVVIGNAAYRKTKPVNFAINDARAVKNYLISTMGYKEGNILYYENATYSDLLTLFGDKGNPQGKLFNTVKPGKSDVFIYYSGHGAPGLKDHKGYFVPTECDPEYVELGGFSLDTFYENLAQVPARSVTVVMDACFSGSTIYENISPIVIKSKGSSGIKNGVLLSSSASSQVSCWYNDKYHSLFTYFFLKSMQNKNADFNKDNSLTLSEIYKYVSDNGEGVPYNARRLHGVEQTPTLDGVETERILVKYP